MTTRQLQVAIYARVSSERQADAGTIASQLDALKEQVRDDGFDLEDELCFIDDGYSGATLLRPGLERLRDVAAGGALDRLYVHSPDRLSRKYAYQVLLLEELERCGVEVTFLNHKLGSTPEEDLLLQVQGMVSEYERAKMMERARRGKRHRARQGSIAVLSSAPYGYRYIPASESGGDAEYRIVLEEAQVVRQMFEWLGRDRCTLGDVHRRLANQGTCSPKGNRLWNRATILRLLNNPAYTGNAAFGKTRSGPRRKVLRPKRNAQEQSRRPYTSYQMPKEDWVFIAVPAIVSEDLFASVQDQLAENRKVARRRRRGATYLLQGLLVCKRCGYSLYGKRAGSIARAQYSYYRCIGTDSYRFEEKRICDNRQVRTDLLDEAVWMDVCSLLQDPSRIEEEFQRRLRKDDNVDETQVEQMRTRMQRLKRGIGRLIDAYEEGLLEKSEFEPRIKKSKERLERIEVALHAAEEQRSQESDLRLVLSRVEDFAKRVSSGIEGADWDTRREIIRSLVKRVEVDEDNVNVVYRVNPLALVGDRSEGIPQHCCRRLVP